MFDIQNLAAVPATRSKKFFISESTEGQRKRDAGNPRRVALDHLLQREHKREMRDALSGGSPVDIIFDEGCTVCDLSIDTCSCNNNYPHGQDYRTRYERGSVTNVTGGNSKHASFTHEVLTRPLQEFQTQRELAMNLSFSILESILEPESDADFNAPKRGHELRFSTLPGGRMKKIKNRYGDCYYQSEYKRPVRRLNGFNDHMVREHFDCIAEEQQEARTEAAKAAEAARLAKEQARAAAKKAKKKAKKARRLMKQHERILAGHQHRNVKPVVITTAHTSTSRLPAGRIMKEPGGTRLIYVVYEEALAA